MFYADETMSYITPKMPRHTASKKRLFIIDKGHFIRNDCALIQAGIS